MNLLKDRKEFKKKNLLELLNMCLENDISISELVLKRWIAEGNALEDHKERIVDMGSLVTGTVYLSKKKYKLTGFIIKKEIKNMNKLNTMCIFIPIFVDSEDVLDLNEDPIFFDNCLNIFDDHGFVSDSMGNVIHFDKVLITKQKVESFIKRLNYDLNKEIKARGIILNYKIVLD